MVNEEYKVDLDVFEGPLDLLLYLIKRDEVDIYNIPIEKITTQYMEYLSVMRMLDLNIAGEFLVMAATLMMIKSRLLLPVEERPEMEEEEDDPRWDLVRQLVEYKQFKDAAGVLELRGLYQENIFDAGLVAVDLVEDSGLSLSDVSLFDLIAAFNDVLKKSPVEAFGEIEADRYTVSDKIDELLALTRQKTQISFVELLSAMRTRNEIICSFLAVLELLKLQLIVAQQDGRFGIIVIVNNEAFAEIAADAANVLPEME